MDYGTSCMLKHFSYAAERCGGQPPGAEGYQAGPREGDQHQEELPQHRQGQVSQVS